jgi:hypothetical protein
MNNKFILMTPFFIFGVIIYGKGSKELESFNCSFDPFPKGR